MGTNALHMGTIALHMGTIALHMGTIIALHMGATKHRNIAILLEEGETK